jgi:hypothetical protein
MGNGEKFAVWLIPTRVANAQWRVLVESVSETFGGPVFAPHVTMLGGLFGPPGEIAGAMRAALAEWAGPLFARVEGVHASDEYYRSLHFRVEGGERLLDLRSAMERALVQWRSPERMGEEFAPHLSLLYGPAPDDSKTRVIAELGAHRGAPLPCDRVEIWAVGGEVSAWRMVDAVELEPG